MAHSGDFISLIISVICRRHYSTNNKYSHEINSKKDFLKKGKERNELFNNIIEEFNNEVLFRYCILFRDDLIKLNSFEPNQSLKLKKGLILYSFLKNMSFRENVDILFDGYIGNKEQTNEILSFLKFYFSNVNIYTKGKGGGVKIPIINFADRIAYLFLKEFNQHGNNVFTNNFQSLINLNYENRFHLKTHEFCKLLNKYRNDNI